MNINEFPHLVLLASNPELKEKLGKDILALINFFEKQFNIYENYKIVGPPKMKDAMTKVKEEAKASLMESSDMITDYITEFIKDVPDPVVAQASEAAKEEVIVIKEEIIDSNKDAIELFEDLEEFIKQEVEVDKPGQHLLFPYVDKVREIQNTPNPNYMKKYKMEGDKRVYQD